MLCKYSEKIKAGALIAFAAFVPLFAHAGFWDGFFEFAVTGVVWLLQWIGGLLFALSGQLALLFLNLNYTIITENTFVAVGWGIMRDIANLGFVLFMIIIAIGTILRLKEYRNEQALVRLIAAAILVNFSLAIAGVVLDASHILTRFFFQPITSGGTGELVKTISGAFNPQALLSPQEPTFENPEDEPSFLGTQVFTTHLLLMISRPFFTLAFTLIGTFVMLAFAIMYIIRYLKLSILLISAPLEWLFWVLPQTKGRLARWWRDFFKWCFFAPASAFFVYLALVTMESIRAGVGATDASDFFSDGMLGVIMGQGAKIVILSGFLLQGLSTAQKLSEGAAKGFVKWGEGRARAAQAWAKTRAKAGAQRLASAPLRSEVGSRVSRVLQGQKVTWKDKKTGEEKTWQLPEAMRKGPVGRAVGYYTGARALGDVLERARVTSNEAILKDADARTGKLSVDELLGRFARMSDPEKIAALTKIERSDALNKLDVMDYMDEKMLNKWLAHGKSKGAWAGIENRAGVDKEQVVVLKEIKKILDDQRKQNPETLQQYETFQRLTREMSGLKRAIEEGGAKQKRQQDRVDEMKASGYADDHPELAALNATLGETTRQLGEARTRRDDIQTTLADLEPKTAEFRALLADKENALRQKAEAFFLTKKKGDFDKMPVNDIFNADDVAKNKGIGGLSPDLTQMWRSAMVHGIATAQPGNFNRLVGGATAKNFVNVLAPEIRAEIAKMREIAERNNDEAMRERAKKLEKVLEKAEDNRMLGTPLLDEYLSGGGGGGTEPASAPAA